MADENLNHLSFLLFDKTEEELDTSVMTRYNHQSGMV